MRVTELQDRPREKVRKVPFPWRRSPQMRFLVAVSVRGEKLPSQPSVLAAELSVILLRTLFRRPPRRPPRTLMPDTEDLWGGCAFIAR